MYIKKIDCETPVMYMGKLNLFIGKSEKGKHVYKVVKLNITTWFFSCKEIFNIGGAMRTIDIVIMYVKGYLTNEYLIQWVRDHEEQLSKTYYGLYTLVIRTNYKDEKQVEELKNETKRNDEGKLLL